LNFVLVFLFLFQVNFHQRENLKKLQLTRRQK